MWTKNDSSINDINRLCQQYLQHIYQQTNKSPPFRMYKKNNLAETYGEILLPSICKLLSIVSLNENDVFVDLGSGLGKIAAQIFLCTKVKKSVGIEIISPLHQVAITVAQKIQSDLPYFYRNQRELIFLLGNFLEIFYSNATVVLLNSTCFNQALLTALGKLIDNTPSIHTVFTLRPIYLLQRLPFKKTVRIECSWDTSLCYIYTNQKI